MVHKKVREKFHKAVKGASGESLFESGIGAHQACATRERMSPSPSEGAVSAGHQRRPTMRPESASQNLSLKQRKISVGLSEVRLGD